MHKQREMSKEPSVHYRKSTAKYNKLRTTIDSCSESDDEYTQYTNHNTNSMPGATAIVSQPHPTELRTEHIGVVDLR